MGIKLRDAFGGIGRRQFRAHPCGHGRELRFAGRDVLNGGDHFSGTVAGDKVFDQAAEGQRAFFGTVQRGIRTNREGMSHSLLLCFACDFAFCSLRVARGGASSNGKFRGLCHGLSKQLPEKGTSRARKT